MQQNLVYKKRASTKKINSKSPESPVKQIMYVDYKDQLSPQVKGTFFFETAPCIKNATAVSLLSSGQLSPEEKVSISKFYDEFQKTMTDSKKTQELLAQTIIDQEKDLKMLYKSKT